MRANRKISDGPFRNKLGEMPSNAKNAFLGIPRCSKRKTHKRKGSKTQNAKRIHPQNAKRKKTQKRARGAEPTLPRRIGISTIPTTSPTKRKASASREGTVVLFVCLKNTTSEFETTGPRLRSEKTQEKPTWGETVAR